MACCGGACLQLLCLSVLDLFMAGVQEVLLRVAVALLQVRERQGERGGGGDGGRKRRGVGYRGKHPDGLTLVVRAPYHAAIGG